MEVKSPNTKEKKPRFILADPIILVTGPQMKTVMDLSDILYRKVLTSTQ